MALDPDVRRAISPTGSGRSSPIPRASKRHAEEGVYKADKVLRRYGTAIERALGSWESSPEEWADYIAFLSRLLKDSTLLPHGDEVAYKLAQCLNPALPSGVHQKALEIYDYIFSAFGVAYASDHLHEFLPGLSAVLSFASLSVRPMIYSIYEDYFLHVPPQNLRPVLKSLVLSLLPGLEDETSEDFEQALRLLERLGRIFTNPGSDDSNDSDHGGYFWQCLFLAGISNPSRRQGTLNFLSRKLPSFRSIDGKVQSDQHRAVNGRSSQLTEQAKAVISPEPGLLIRCFVCGLSDPQILIQRGFLDLLVANLPLDSPLLKERIGNRDLDLLVSAAIQVLLRREMSLNRRLWSWFLGPEPKTDGTDDPKDGEAPARTENANQREASQYTFFVKYGKSSLERCVLAMFQGKAQDVSGRARPFRICLSLMDRWEIGGSIVPNIFLPAMRSVYRYSLAAVSEDTAELLRSASLFFDGVEASLIWNNLLTLVRASLTKSAGNDGLDMFSWIIQTFNLQDEEMQLTHIPLAASFLLALVQTAPFPGTRDHEMLLALDLVPRLLEMIPERAFTTLQKKPPPSQTSSKSPTDPAVILRRLDEFYGSEGQADNMPFSGPLLANLLLQLSTSLLAHAIRKNDETLFSRAATNLITLKSRLPLSVPVDKVALSEVIFEAVDMAESSDHSPAFTTLSSILSLLLAFGPNKEQQALFSKPDIIELEHFLLHHLWTYLSPNRPKYHVEAVKFIWQLEDSLTPDGCLSSSINHFVRLTGKDVDENVRRFTVLWGHSVVASSSRPTRPPRRVSGLPTVLDARHSQNRQDSLIDPLMIILDMLDNRCLEDGEIVRIWLQNLPTLPNVFRIHFELLARYNDPTRDAANTIQRSAERRRADDLRGLEYVLGHFQNILLSASEWTWQCLASISVANDQKSSRSGVLSLADCCCQLICDAQYANSKLERTSIELLDMLLQSPSAASLKPLELEARLLQRTLESLSKDQFGRQSSMLKLLQSTLSLYANQETIMPSANNSAESPIGSRKPSAQAAQPSPNTSTTSLIATPPPQLLTCLQAGFSARCCRTSLDHWLNFLADVLSMFGDTILISLIPMVETLCSELQKAHSELQSMSKTISDLPMEPPEPAISALIDALEMLLARAHDWVAEDTSGETTAKTPTQSRGLLGNVTTSMFKADGIPNRTAQSNSRLTVVLAFQDAVRTCFNLWTWATRHSSDPEINKSSAATSAYNALRVRNRSRHLLEQAFAAEPLESLEVVASMWSYATEPAQLAAPLDLLHILQEHRPKVIVTTILDALYSRLNPSGLPLSRQSCQSTDLTPLDITLFLSAYLKSTEDDAMDEIWADLMTFLKDVLSNPLSFRQILPALLAIVLLLAQKLENTNFGEQRKMRRDLGDILLRLLSAIFAAIPSGAQDVNGADATKSISLAVTLRQVVESVETILESTDRANSVVNTIATSLIAPTFHSKAFPGNVNSDVLALLLQMCKKAPAAKSWRKELVDAFNDPKILQCSPEQMQMDWFPVLRQWCLHDKERVPDILARLTAPSSAGIMFGVGASAARLEADRKTQLNLRRLSLLLLASGEDAFVAHLRAIEEKMVELFEATAASSPSAAVKAEIFMLCRALALSITAVHLAPFWPLFNNTMQSALMSLTSTAPGTAAINNMALLQVCKLLDFLVAASPDEFQLYEWLYVSDTIDAVYQPPDWQPAALSDQIAESLGTDEHEDLTSPVTPATLTSGASGRRKPLLDDSQLPNKDDIKAMTREDFAHAVLRPFFTQLSLHAYEGFYSMEVPDLEACRRNLLGDLLDPSTIVE